jgi:2-dehydro-3-deoxyphosphogalactonate aldolase
VPVFAVGGVTPENLAQWMPAVWAPGWAAIFIAPASPLNVPHSRRPHLLKRIERQCNENNQTHHVPFTPALDVPEN